MTCVLVVSDGHAVVMGGDSALSSPGSSEIYDTAIPKVSRIGPYVVGCCGQQRLSLVVRFAVDWPEPPAQVDPDRFMISTVVPAIRTTIREHDGIVSTDRCPVWTEVQTLVGFAGRIWAIGKDLSVSRLNTPYAAIGDGRLPAYGALYALEREPCLPLLERARLALEASARYTACVRPPFHFVSTDHHRVRWSHAAGAGVVLRSSGVLL
jgi:hypothetical protein